MRNLVVLAFAISGFAAEEWGSGVWRGRDVVFKVVDAMAVAEGDMVLGSEPEITSPAAPQVAKSLSRESAVINSSRFLWPDGRVPYIIDQSLPNRQRITDAIQHWHEKTPIRLVERTNEANYVRFVRREGACSSFVGMAGRDQAINLADSCTKGAVIHEIGHAVGLYHEQSRHDRDFYISLKLQNVDKREVANFNQYLNDGRDLGGYDYGSIMHYDTTAYSRNGKPVIGTIPAGIPISQREVLSPDDIDAVNRLYGFPIDGLTISTFPFELDVEVDGERFRAPRTFRWTPGSRHTISVPEGQGSGNIRYSFGRWSDSGSRTHSILVANDRSVITAHMIQEFRLPLGVTPADAGRLIVNPPSADGYYPAGIELEIRPVANDGYVFRQWTGFGLFNIHGVSPDPLRIVVADRSQYIANFTRAPVTTVTSEPAGLKLRVDGATITTPKGFTWADGSEHTVAVEDVTQTTALETARHKFLGWSDEGASTHTITAGPESGTVTARFQTQYLLVRPRVIGGSVDVNPASEDGFYDDGATVQIIPNASVGLRFQNWTGDLSGSETPSYLKIDDQKLVSATFALPGTLSANSVVSAASMLNQGGVTPGGIVSIYGVDIASESAAGTRVLFDEFTASLLYVSRNQISAVVPYGIAGRSQTTLRITNAGGAGSSRTLPVLIAAPSLFTADSSGKGQAAALNQDGSYNSSQNPAPKRSVVVLYATGEGDPKLPVRVRIGGQQAVIEYAGAAPASTAGLMQVNVRIPEECPSGAVPIVLSVSEYSSLANVSIAVR